MAYVKIIFRSINDLSVFIRQNTLRRFEMAAAQFSIIAEDRQYILPPGCTLIPLTDVDKKAPQHLSGAGMENSNA